MAVVASGNITQAAAGSPLTFTDTSTGVGTLISRTLTIYDSNGEVLTVISMGASLTATYAITTDQYLTFIEVIVDNTGTYEVLINYLSTAFYEITFANVISQLGCDCNCGSEQLTYSDISQLFNAAAQRYALGGFGPAAQNAITAANTIINGN